MHHLNRCLFLTSLLFSVLTVDAMQLGSAKGTAVFGRPLDLIIQVRLEAPAEQASNCFNAEVFQADNKFDAGRVHLDVTPAANGLDATVRVRSTSAVNEPWAKVILRSNCGSKVSRQYDFLTDFPIDTPASNTLAETTTATNLTLPNLANVANVVNAANTQSPASKVSNLNGKRSSAKPKAPQQKPNTQIAQTPLTAKQVKPILPADNVATRNSTKVTDTVGDTTGQPRLKMETYELTDEHQVMLKLSTALIAPTNVRTPEESQALAQATAVWRAINGMPAEIKNNEAVTADAVATSTQTKDPIVLAPSSATPTSIPSLMKEKLAAKSELSNLMVYGLLGLLALTLACIAWLWLRVRQASRAGYGWLNDMNEAMADKAIAEDETLQSTHSIFFDTKAETPSQTDSLTASHVSFHEARHQAPHGALEPILEPEKDTEIKTASIAPATQAPAGKVFVKVAKDVVKDNEKPAAVSSLAPQKELSLSSRTKPKQPSHLNDPRFDERVLRNNKKKPTHEEPSVSSAEFMDSVFADMPQKLALANKPASKQIDKTSVNAPNKTTPKDEPKGNLINFDVFAEQETLNKPRFLR